MLINYCEITQFPLTDVMLLKHFFPLATSHYDGCCKVYANIAAIAQAIICVSLEKHTDSHFWDASEMCCNTADINTNGQYASEI